MKKFKIKSYCKVNLSLKVIRKLRNGYHDIQSIVTFCNLYDEIYIQKINNDKDKIYFLGKFKKGIDKNKNTIKKVLKLLRKMNFLKEERFAIYVKKNLPHGSGLGGASSNAASLINFLNSKMNLKLTNKKINKIAIQIGSDVPICLNKRNTIIDVKNKLLILRKKFKFNILIVYPNLIYSTKKVYDKNKIFSLPKPYSRLVYKNNKKLISFFANEKNDLEKAAMKINPRIKILINFIKNLNGCHFSRISGSGSACIGIFSDMKTALYAKRLINLKFPKYWCRVSKTI